MPYNDDYLIFGCSNSIWILAGDPAGGGSLDPMNETTGIMGRDAWCKDGDGNTYFVGTDGIYRIAKNLSSFENITMAKIPTIIEDLGLDADKQVITMGYDGRQHGVVISVTTREDGRNENFWYDLRTLGFFPEGYHASDALFSQFYYKADNAEYKRLMVGCSDGFIRTFDIAEKNDSISDVNLVGHWRMNDDAGQTVVADGSIYRNDGAASSNVVSAAGAAVNTKTSITFSGDPDVITIGDDPAYNFADQMSFFTWVNISNFSASAPFASKWPATHTEREWAIGIGQTSGSNAEVTVLLGKGSGSTQELTDSYVLPLDTWTLVGFTFDAGTVTIYINGIAVASTEIGTHPTSIQAGASDILIGQNLALFFEGDLDDVRLYNKTLSTDEIDAIYNSGKGDEIIVADTIAAIDSYVVLGPKPLSTDDFANTQITDLVMISGGGGLGGSELDTDGLTMDLHVKDTSEGVTEAIKAGATPQYTYTQSGPGRAQNQRPKIAGLVAGIKLSNDELDQTWAIEKVIWKTKPFGRHK
jgi:hypothetical protein